MRHTADVNVFYIRSHDRDRLQAIISHLALISLEMEANLTTRCVWVGARASVQPIRCASPCSEWQSGSRTCG